MSAFYVYASAAWQYKPSSNIGGDEYMNGPYKCLNGTSPCAGDLVDWPRNNRDNYSCEDIAHSIVSTVVSRDPLSPLATTLADRLVYMAY